MSDAVPNLFMHAPALPGGETTARMQNRAGSAIDNSKSGGRSAAPGLSAIGSRPGAAICNNGYSPPDGSRE